MDRLASLGNRPGSVESCDQISRDWDHDYDWLLLDDDSSVPKTSWRSSPEWNARCTFRVRNFAPSSSPKHREMIPFYPSIGPSTQDLATYVWMAHLLDLKNFLKGTSSLLLPGERGYRAREEVTAASLAASIRAHPRAASELDPLNYFQLDWSCTNPRNHSARWTPFPHIRPVHPPPPPSGEDRRHSRDTRELATVIAGLLLSCKFEDEDHMPDGDLLDGFAELYKQNKDMRLDLGILDALNDPGLSKKFAYGTVKERKHRAWHSEERCSICLEDYVDGEYIKILECRHMFHPRCINRWILKKNRCPICNTNVLQNDSSSDGEFGDSSS